MQSSAASARPKTNTPTGNPKNPVDCQRSFFHTPLPWFMVTDDVWASAVPEGPRVLLCHTCLEARLGRTLARADFTDALVNDWFFNVHPEYATT